MKNSILNIVLKSISKGGLIKTIQFIFFEYWFDIRFLVNTRPKLFNYDSDIVSGHVLVAEPHYGTNWLILKKAFSILIKNGFIYPSNTYMVDYGSGSGRAMMAAIYFGIARVTGVEFSGELCTQAQKNLQKFIKKNNRNTYFWSVENVDAALFSIPSGVIFSFFIILLAAQ